MKKETSSLWARSRVGTLLLIVATAGGIYLCYRLALPFLPAIAWALALAVLVKAAQEALLRAKCNQAARRGEYTTAMERT
jgi:predicted PurR-regulated permease PerM